MSNETISNQHAMRFNEFCLVGSVMLLSLFPLFKFVSKDLVNAVLTCYFFVLGIVALSATMLPALKRFFPKDWNENQITWQAPIFHSLLVEFTKSQLVAAIPGLLFCVWYALRKHWLANNILGIVFCIQGIEMLSLGSFKTSAILLAGLFFYDILWVFFTPVMVSVAKSFDAPIKIDATRPFSMLGIFVALVLRFGVPRGKENRHFRSAFLGYTGGIILTNFGMHWLQAAPPALLYIVAIVLTYVGMQILLDGEVNSAITKRSETVGSMEFSSEMIILSFE
ncbi:Signal peptide peptidase 1 [Carex littledalei]|uniref:Signal peptide peptidase 1 n=1 Tax=Carex littledalei TaxID=544730 RepID=A0A833RKL4_9POAL|nr:Signal peptide peptidase 1 [Carex littledalei]